MMSPPRITVRFTASRNRCGLMLAQPMVILGSHPHRPCSLSSSLSDLLPRHPSSLPLTLATSYPVALFLLPSLSHCCTLSFIATFVHLLYSSCSVVVISVSSCLIIIR